MTAAGVSGGARRVSAQQTTQSGWSHQDIGSPAIAGSMSTTPDGFTITAGGTDIWGTSDQLHFVYQQVTGDVDVRARVDSIANSSAWAKAGVMIRDALTASAAHGLALVSAGRGTAFQRRIAASADTTHTAGVAVAPPEWVRLVRRGTNVSAYTSADGSTWTLIGSDTIQLGASAYVGIAVTSHNASAATTAAVSQVTVTPLGLPSGQQDADIGGPAIAGAASYNSGRYQIHAGGTDIWGTADQFHYVYQPVSGDVDVSLRVASVTAAHSWSKAGVMIRETLTAGSAHAFALVSAGRGYAFQRRTAAGEVSLNTSGGSGTPPGWVRVKRAGSLFTAYRSADGQSWAVIGSEVIPMADTAYVGIAVTSHDALVATDVVADTLKVTASVAANQPPSVSLTAPANGSTLTAPASITLSAIASDPENQLTKVEFYNGSTLIGTDTASPYGVSWSSVPAGTYSLTAVAYDAAGLTARSPAVSVTVGAVTSPPAGVMFTPSLDDAIVTSYRLDVFAAGADPYTATPVSSYNGGHPAPDTNGDITVLASSFFSALAAGNYQLTVTAVSSIGSGRSAPIAFTR